MCFDLQRDNLRHPAQDSYFLFFEPKASIKTSNNVTNLPFFSSKPKKNQNYLKKAFGNLVKKLYVCTRNLEVAIQAAQSNNSRQVLLYTYYYFLHLHQKQFV